jgi:Domain of unknown function (DUF5753)/Helix-turn-helix domain
MTELRPDGSSAGPTILRMILGRQLQALREKAGLSIEEAGQAIFSSEWTVRRMEKGDGGMKPMKVKGLLLRYGVTDVREVDAFLALVKDANTPGWWHNYSDVLPNWFRAFPGLEEAASIIRGYEPQCVPGLLQTEAYARALTVAGYPEATADEIGRRIALRLTRQRLLTRPEPPHLWVVLDETVLRRPVGGREVMREQLGRLVETASLPNVTLQVLPFTAGQHQAMYGLFYVFRFPSPELKDVVFGENMTSAFYLDKPEDVSAYVMAMDRICALAASAEETVGIIRDALKGL